jgi:NTE family protein
MGERSALSPSAYAVLHTFAPFRRLGAAQREELAARFREQTHAKGAVLFREGDPGASFYIVVSGQVEVRAGDRVVAYFGPGECFGEMALLTGAPRSATVVVVLDCRLLVLDGRAFSHLLRSEPRLYQELAAILSRRVFSTSRGEGSRRRNEVVLIHDARPWAAREALLRTLVGSLERELGREIAIVTVVRSASNRLGLRRSRSDLVLACDERKPAAVRDALAAQLAKQGTTVPLSLVVAGDGLTDSLHELERLADTVVVFGEPPRRDDAASEPHRRIVVHDRTLASTAASAVSSAGNILLPAVEPWRSRAVGSLARVLTRRSVGLALGSGAAYGLSHIGVLKVLDDAGVPLDFIAGASIGAIVGAAYALGLSPQEIHEAIMRAGNRAALLKMWRSLVRMAMDVNLVSAGMFSGSEFLSFLGALGLMRDSRFADLVRPFRAVATDIQTGARVDICDGAVGDAVRASVSAPWVFSPHRIGDHVLIDGGMVDPVPSETVRAMGADLVIAVNVVPALDPRTPNPLDAMLHRLDWLNPLAYLSARPHLPNSFDVVAKTLLIMQHELGKARASEADVLINPQLGQFWLLEFWSAAAMIEKGAESAREALPKIQALREPSAAADVAATHPTAAPRRRSTRRARGARA